jgi:acyl carrier protein
MNKDQAIEIIKEKLGAVLNIPIDQVDWSYSEALDAKYSLDSFMLIDVLIGLEADPRIRFDIVGVTMEHLASINALADYIACNNQEV